ncbi:MAG: FtsX-like permease family protein [Alphaproteobacteria bacterium]|nr:FtsX-like permease family protein [Alphaproteobacteria bacterium]
MSGSLVRGFWLSLVYARREMRSGVRGFYIFIACLVLGVAMISAVASVSQGMSDSLRHDGRYILGGDLAIRTPHVPPAGEVIRFVENDMGGRTSIITETRAMARHEKTDMAAIVEIKAVDAAWPLYGAATFTDIKGAAIDTPQTELFAKDANGIYGAAVEKDILARLDAAVGDTVHLGEVPFVIRAVIGREPDSVNATGFALAPRLLTSLEAFQSTGLTGAGNLLEYRTRIAIPNLDSEAQLESAKAKILQKFGEDTFRIRTFLNASPSIERYINRLTLFLMLIGLTTLLVGGVGISNAVKSFLDSRLAEIATLKCLGAPQGFVFRTYLFQILLLSFIGVALGVVIGSVSAVFTGAILTQKFSLSDQTGIYPLIWAQSAAFGFLITLCFSLWPLGRAVRTRPTDLFRDLIAPSYKRPAVPVLIWIGVLAAVLGALVIHTAPIPRFAVYFVFSAFVTFGVFQLASFVIQHILRRLRPRKNPEARMAIANLTRPGNATSSIVLSLGLGLTVLVAIAQVEHNFSRLLGDDLAADLPSFFLLDIQSDQKDDFTKIVMEAKGAKNLIINPSMRGRVVSVNGVDAQAALKDPNEEWVTHSDRGFTYLSDMPPHSRITEGEWWPKDYKGAPALSIASNVARAFGIGVGDKMVIEILGVETEATVMNVREISWASFAMNFAMTFAPGAVDDIPAPFIATVIVDSEAETPLQSRLARELPNVTSVRIRDALELAQGVLRAIADAVRVSAALTLIAGTLVLSGGIAAARRRHVYDAVVLKVLGATRGRIMRTFLLEYAVLGIITVSIAAGLGTLGGWAAMNFILNMPFSFSAAPVLWVTGLCLGITVLAGMSGTWRAMGQKPAPYLRNP